MVVRETLAITAKAVDQTSGPINAAAGSMTKAAGDVEKANAKTGVSFESMGNAVTAANQAYQLGSAIIGKFTDAIGEAVEAANIQIAAERKLEATLGLSGSNTEKRIKGINTFNTAIQQTLGIGDERLLQLESLLLAQGVEADQVQSAIRQTIGLAEVTGSLETSVKLVGRALNGETSALTRYGIQADSVGEVQDKLNDLFEVALSQADTFATAQNKLSANTDDLIETLGLVVVKTEFFTESTSRSANAVLGLTIAIQTIDSATRDWATSLDLLDKAEEDGEETTSLYLDTVVELHSQLFKFLIPGLREASNAFDTAADAGEDAAEAAKEAAAAFEELPMLGPTDEDVRIAEENFKKWERAHKKFLRNAKRDRERARKDEAKGLKESADLAIAALEFDQQQGEEGIKEEEKTLGKLIELNDSELEAEKALEQSIADAKQENRDFEREEGSALRELQNQEDRDRVDEAEASANKISGALASSFTSVITGTQSVGQAFEGLFLRIASSFLENAIGSIFSGIFNVISGGVGGGVVGLISGLFHEGGVVPGFADGGLVTGGQRGSDSVLIAAEPGEVVVPVDIVEAFRGILSNTGGGPGFQGGGVVGGGGGGGDINITLPLTVKSLIGDQAVGDRIVQEDLVPALQRAAEMGFLGFFPQLFSGSL